MERRIDAVLVFSSTPMLADEAIAMLAGQTAGRSPGPDCARHLARNQEPVYEKE
jgi:hypothetical protein